MQSVFHDHARPPDSSPAPAGDRPGAVVDRFDRLSRLTSILNPTLRLGRVEFTFGGHVVWVMFMIALVSIQPMPLNALGDVLALLLLVYAVLQAGRVLHEFGHAVVGLLCGRELLRIRLTSTVMAVWFPEGDPVWSVRLTCLAGSVVQAMFGSALLLIATTSSPNWLLGLRQSLEIVGAMHIGALTNLLPLPKMDGQYVWGSALRTRPFWLAYAPAVLGPVLAVALICPHLPDPELQEILALFANPVILAGMLLLLLCGLPLIPRLQLPPETTPPTLNSVDRAKAGNARKSAVPQ